MGTTGKTHTHKLPCNVILNILSLRKGGNEFTLGLKNDSTISEPTVQCGASGDVHRVVFPSCQRALHRLTFIWCTVLYSECILQEFKPEPQLSFIYVELKDLTVIHLLYNHWDINSFSVTVSIEAANQKITSSSATLFSYNC